MQRLFQIGSGAQRSGCEGPICIDPVHRQMIAPGRDLHGKGAAFAKHALHVYRAAVDAYELLHERETDTRAFVGPPTRPLDAIEALEDAWQRGFGYARAGVAHAEHHGTPFLAEA